MEQISKVTDKVLEGLSHQKENTTISDRKPTDEERKKMWINSAYTNMDLPKLYKGKTLLNFKGFEKEAEKAKEEVFNKHSLFISGECGTGKTHLAVGLMCAWYEKRLEEDMDKRDIYPKFLPAVELFLELKKSFDKGGESIVLNKYSGQALLVIDDVGAEKISDWSRQIFYTLIDRRYRNMGQTIITSNLSPKEFAEKFDDRIASRLCEMGEAINLKGKDWRVNNET